jgi:hypothetical protein
VTSPVEDLVTGFAQHLADAGVGVWSPDAPYGPDDVAIVYGTERPIDNQQVILNWTDLDQHPEITQGAGLLQVTVKGLPNDRGSTDALAYAAFSALHGLTNLPLGASSASAATACRWGRTTSSASSARTTTTSTSSGRPPATGPSR